MAEFRIVLPLDLTKGGYLGRRVIGAWDDGPDPLVGEIIGVTENGRVVVVWDGDSERRPLGYFADQLCWVPPKGDFGA